MLEEFVINQSIVFVKDLIIAILFIIAFDIFADECWKVLNKKGVKKDEEENEPKNENRGVIGFIKRHKLPLSVYIFLQMLIIIDRYQESIGWIPDKYL